MRKGYTPIFLVLIGIIVIAASSIGGIYLYKLWARSDNPVILSLKAKLYQGIRDYSHTLNNLSASREISAPTSLPSPSPDATPAPTPNWLTYKGAGFTFNYPPAEKAQKQPSPNQVAWKMTEDNYEWDAMTLTWQSHPLTNPGEDPEFSITESKEITLDGASAHSYIIDCGNDCFFHEVQFKSKGIYFALRKNIAGGGLEQDFQEILSSLKFTN